VLEDLLRNDPEERTESKVALAKVLIRSYVSTTDPNEENLLEAIRILSSGTLSDDRLKLIHAIALALWNDDLDNTVNYFLALQPFPDPKRECRRLYWTMRMLSETGRQENAIPYAQEALALNGSSLPAEFIFPVVSLAATILRDTSALQKLVEMSGKVKIQSPQPHLALARLSTPPVAFTLMSALVRITALPVTNIFSFEFKPPFLMARPADVSRIRTEVLEQFISSAIASGNFMKLLFLFNPTNNIDQKVSRVLTRNRFVYGVDRIYVFELYVRELINLVAKKSEKGSLENALVDRALDSLVRGSQIEVSENLRGYLDQLFALTWKVTAGEPAPPEATVKDLIRLISDTEEEDDEEEDEDFVDSPSSGETDDEARPVSKRATVEPESIEESESGEEEEESAEEGD
jgi:hypothetical protein